MKALKLLPKPGVFRFRLSLSVLFDGGGVTLTKATQVVAVLTVESVFTAGNGPIGDMYLQVGGNRVGGFFQSQNSNFSQPLTLLWVGQLPVGAHPVSVSISGRTGLGQTSGLATLHVLALE